jgi:hypothetical protein
MIMARSSVKKHTYRARGTEAVSYSKMYGSTPSTRMMKPSSGKEKKSGCKSGNSSEYDYDHTGWKKSEVPEYKSIPHRDLSNIPQINTEQYITACCLW